jgi:alkanesulfonate monooxygenase SsuD/methylene tetrahydromethanopterin reductase-like flavin-dependent oxidoreductase (luciferase family)
MIIGVGLDGRLGLPFGQLREVANHAEALGFESLWTPAGGVPDAFHVCAAWSLDTSLRTGISVVPAARMWTPMTLAIQAATLAQLSSGRFVLGLGTGGVGPSFWKSVGLPNRPITVMRAYTTAVRQLLAGQTVTAEGPGVRLQSASLGLEDLPPAPVYLAALGPQMLRLAGEIADGALLNWATPPRIATSRALVAEGAARAGRDPGEISTTMYVRVCIDDDVTAARQMGFDDVLRELEGRRDRGESLAQLVDAAPDELLRAVGYFGPAAQAPTAFARLSAGLDETIVRIITARSGPEPVVEAMTALTPAAIRAADQSIESLGPNGPVAPSPR